MATYRGSIPHSLDIGFLGQPWANTTFEGSARAMSSQSTIQNLPIVLALRSCRPVTTDFLHMLTQNVIPPRKEERLCLPSLRLWFRDESFKVARPMLVPSKGLQIIRWRLQSTARTNKALTAFHRDGFCTSKQYAEPERRARISVRYACLDVS